MKCLKCKPGFVIEDIVEIVVVVAVVVVVEGSLFRLNRSQYKHIFSLF